MRRQGTGWFGWMLVGTLFLAIVSMAGLAPAQSGPGGPGGPSQGQRLLTPEDRAAMGQIFWHRIQAQLGLTDQQVADIRANMQQNRQTMRQDFQGLRTARQQLRQLMETPTADATAIQTAAGQVKVLQAKLFDERLQGQLTLRSKLTPEQLAKWTELRKGMGHRMGRRGGPGHEGGFGGGPF